ncbi:MAG: O-antigen ligase family protein [Nitrospirae bacterium]|nr:O-antigen ligase family protein [Nitrospirota bacterium]
MNRDLFLINTARILAGVMIWLSLHQFRLKEEEKEGILWIIFISAVIASLLAVMQPYVLTDYIPPAGGVFQQKNLYASWAATGIAISLYLITAERFKGCGTAKKTLYFISILILSAGIVLADSRSGLIGAVLAVTALLAVNLSDYIKIKKHLAVWMLIFAVGMGSGLYLSGMRSGKAAPMEEVKEKAKWLSDTGQRSYTERLLMYRTSYEMFKEKPLFGQGFSNFESLYMYHQAETAEKNPEYKKLINDYISHPHNEMFYILAECGVAGMIAVGVALYGIGRALKKAGRKKAGVYIALFIPLFVHMMVEFPLKLSTAHYLLFLILLYIVTSEDADEKEVMLGKTLKRAVIVASLSLYALTAAYTLKTLHDYMHYLAFIAKFETEGVISENSVAPAMNNIYLRNWAVPHYMFAKATEAASDTSRHADFVPQFLKWNDSEKRRRPIRAAFNREALLLYNMGVNDRKQPLYFLNEAMKTVEEGLKIYPAASDLAKLKSMILSAYMKNVYDLYQKKQSR